MSSNNGIRFLQVSLGAVMALHGLSKFTAGADHLAYIGGMPPFVPENATLHLVLGILAAGIELFGGLAVALGFKVRWACLALVLVLLGAISYHVTQVQGFTSLMLNTWPLELAFVFISLAVIGPVKKGE